MSKGIFIVGTGTDIGKTVVTAGLMHVLRSNGYKATYFKAALSGAALVNGELVPGDTKLVSEVSDLKEEYSNLTPYVYKTAVSPHLASKLENNPIDLKIVREKYEKLKEKYDFIIAEGSGGIICPLIVNEIEVYTLENLIKDLNMQVIIVSDAGLGTINHTVLTVKYIESCKIKIKGIILNRYEEGLFYEDNERLIEKLTGISIIGKLKNMKACTIDEIRKNSEEAFKAEQLINYMNEI